MARKEKGNTHLFKDVATSLHIKKNTAGRSNGILLSVLDGLKSQADDRLGEADQKVRLGDLSIFTVSPKKEKKASFIDRPSSSSADSSHQGASRIAQESKRAAKRKEEGKASSGEKGDTTRPRSFRSGASEERRIGEDAQRENARACPGGSRCRNQEKKESAQDTPRNRCDACVFCVGCRIGHRRPVCHEGISGIYEKHGLA